MGVRDGLDAAWLARRAKLLAADHAATRPDSVPADPRPDADKTPNRDQDRPAWARKPKVK